MSTKEFLLLTNLWRHVHPFLAHCLQTLSNAHCAGSVWWSRTRHIVARRGVRLSRANRRHANASVSCIGSPRTWDPRGVSDGAEKLTHQTQAGSFPGKRTSMSTVSCCKCRPALDMSINSGGCGLRQRKKDLEQRGLSGGRADTSSYCTTALSQRSFPLSVVMTNPETSNLANSGV